MFIANNKSTSLVCTILVLTIVTNEIWIICMHIVKNNLYNIFLFILLLSPWIGFTCIMHILYSIYMLFFWRKSINWKRHFFFHLIFLSNLSRCVLFLIFVPKKFFWYIELYSIHIYFQIYRTECHYCFVIKYASYDKWVEFSNFQK